VVRQFGTSHTEIELSADGLRELLPRALDAMDQPTVDGINTFVVARQARAAGLTVALSGIGADELFGGYPSFNRVPQLQQIARWLPVPAGRAAARFAPLLGDTDQTRKLTRWLAQDDLDAGAHMLAREVFGPAARAHLAGNTAAEAAPVTTAVNGLASFNSVSYFEILHYLCNMLLRDTDVMGMSQSLEIREPLLDHELVEYVASLPAELKAPRGATKALMVDALGTDIPRWVATRKKMGFALPFARWMHGPLREPVRAALLDRRFGGQIAEALDGTAVEGVWNRFLEGKGTWVRPWSLYALKCWGERHLP
jgi:asparagine synthase (glutamine-hydrolysing)